MAEGSSYEVGQGYVQLTASAKGLQKKVDKELSEVRAEKAVKLDLDAAKLRQDAAKVRAELARLTAEKASPSVDLDIRAAEAKRREVQAQLTALSAKTASPKVDADIAAANQRLGQIDRQLSELNAKRASVDVDADIAAAQAKLDGINRRAQQIESQRVQLQVDADTAGANAQLAGTERQVSSLDGRNAQVSVAASGAAGASAQLGLVVAGLAAVASMAPVAGAALAGALATASGAGQALGAIKAGFSGIGDALKATEAAEKSAATTSASSGAARAASARAVESAVGALAQAQNQANRAAITGAQQVRDAELALGQARQQADRVAVEGAQRVREARQALADAQVSAAQRTADAERQLGTAQESVRFAQEALTRARRDAAEANEDLQLSLSGIAISERRALLTQQKALESLRAGLASGVSGTQLTELQLNVDEATQNLAEVRERFGDLRAEQAEFARTGIEGTRGVTDAHRSLQSAQRGAQDAQRALTQAQVDGARQVSEAQTNLASAQRQASQSQADANARVAAAATALGRAQQQSMWAQQDATRGVQDAQRALAHALADTGATGSAAMGKLSHALDELSPAGRSFVRFMTEEWKPTWERTTDAVAEELLPRVERSMRNLLKLEPVFRSGLSDTGRVLGDLAVRGSEMVTSGPWRADFATIMASNNRALQSWGSAGLSALDATRHLIVAGGPLQERFAAWAAGAMQSAAGFLEQKRQTGELAAFMQMAGDKAAEFGALLGDLMTTAYQVGSALAPVGSVLLDIVGAVVRAVGAFAEANPGIIQFGAVAAIALSTFTALGNKLTSLGAGIAGAAGGYQRLGTLLSTLNPAVATAALRHGTLDKAQQATAASAATAATRSAGFRGVLTAVGGALPLVGAAALGLAVAHDTLTTSSSEAADALLQGGTAAAQMRAELAENDATMARNRQWMPGWLADLEEWNRGTFGIQTTTEQANAALREQIASMPPLEAAQAALTLAQNDYNAASREFGAHSPQAQAALQGVRDRTRELDVAQRAARDGVDLATAAILNQRDQMMGTINADLQKRQAVNEMERAQRAYADAVAQYGADSPQAIDASLQLEAAQNRVATSAGQGADGINGQARAIGQMVMAANGQLTPSLNSMVQGLDHAGLSAAGARVEFDAAGRAVAVFPNGKTVTLDANTSPVYPALAQVKLAVDSTRGTIGVDADTGPGQMMVGGFKLATDNTRGVVTVDGNITPADQARLGIQARTDGTTGTMWINGNPVPADGALNGARFRVDHTTGVMTVDANPGPAHHQIDGAHGHARAPQWFDVDANTTPAINSIGDLFRWIGNKVTDIFGRNGMNEVRAAFGMAPLAEGGLVGPHALRPVGSFASGGRVRGPGTSTSDSIPAMLSNGEFVIRKRAVDAVGVNTLEKLNGFARGGLVGYAKGGRVADEQVPQVPVSSPTTGASTAPTVAVPVGQLPYTASEAAAVATATEQVTASLSTQAGVITSSVVPALGIQTAATSTVSAAQAVGGVGAAGALTVANQMLVSSGILPVVAQLLGTMFPTLAQYQVQTGVVSVAANSALQGSQGVTRASTVATAAQTAASSANMTASTTAMSVASQGQLLNLRNGQIATSNQTVELEYQFLRSWNNVSDFTRNMSAAVQGHLRAVRDAQGETNRSTEYMATWWRDQMARTQADSANPIRWVLQNPFNAGIIAAWNSLDSQFALGKRANPVAIPFAQGGFHEDHSAQITRPGGPMRVWSEPETGGEAYIPMSRSKRGRSTGILSQVAQRFGYSLAPENYADGGIVQFADGGLWRRLGGVAQGLVPGTRVSSGYRPGDSGYHGRGKAVDLVGNMPRINQAIAQRYPHSTQLIYTPGINLFRGRPHTYNAGTRADHYDHVHWAMENEAMLNGAPGMYAGGAGGYFDPTPQIEAAFKPTYDMIAKGRGMFPGPHSAMNLDIAQQGADKVKAAATTKIMSMFDAVMGATSNEAPGIVKIISDVARGRFGGEARKAAVTGVATGLVESNLRNLPYGDRDSVGVFQQRPSMGWGTVQQLMNVTYAAGKFFSRFPGNWASWDQGKLAQHVQRSAYPLKYGQRMGQAAGLVAQFGGFDKGGEAVGRGVMLKDIIEPERVLPPVETQSYNTLTELMGRSGGVRLTYAEDGGGRQAPAVTIHQHLPDGASSRRFASDVMHELRRNEFRGVH